MRYLNVAIVAVIFGFLLSGCTTLQTVNKLDTAKLHNVCIVEHKEVREGVLDAIQETLHAHGIKTQLVPGSYALTNHQWKPTYQVKDVASCDAVLLYVANWTWDITMYMHFANIWVVTTDAMPVRLGDARYDSRASLKKYINAHDKIVELTEELFGLPAGAVSQQPKVIENSSKSNAITPEPKHDSPNTTSSRDDAAQLEQLKSLKDKGIITEDEFNTKKKEILERM